MKVQLAALNDFLMHYGPGVRAFIGLYMLTQGSTRIITGNSAAGINVFSARMFGVLMVVAGVALLVTIVRRQRCKWLGRGVAIYAAAVWLVLISSAIPAQAWVSISGGFIFLGALTNEVRVHAC